MLRGRDRREPSRLEPEEGAGAVARGLRHQQRGAAVQSAAAVYDDAELAAGVIVGGPLAVPEVVQLVTANPEAAVGRLVHPQHPLAGDGPRRGHLTGVAVLVDEDGAGRVEHPDAAGPAGRDVQHLLVTEAGLSGGGHERAVAVALEPLPRADPDRPFGVLGERHDTAAGGGARRRRLFDLAVDEPGQAAGVGSDPEAPLTVGVERRDIVVGEAVARRVDPKPAAVSLAVGEAAARSDPELTAAVEGQHARRRRRQTVRHAVGARLRPQHQDALVGRRPQHPLGPDAQVVDLRRQRRILHVGRVAVDLP